MKAFRTAEKLDKITFGLDRRGWYEIDGTKYWIVTDINNGMGRLWVHPSPAKAAIAFIQGASLLEGDEDANHEYALTVIRERLAS